MQEFYSVRVWEQLLHLHFLALSDDVFQLELGGYFMWFFIAEFLMGCVVGIMLICLMFASGKRK